METIASFTVDHDRLEPGVYLSRQDQDPETGAVVTTFDLRFVRPNREPVLNTAELHTIEHLLATYFRNEPTWSSRTVYFGPMGCRTGCYLVLFGKWESLDLKELLISAFEFICNFEGEIPGAKAKECGNYLDQNLGMAKYWAKRYLTEVLYNLSEKNTQYPA